MKTIPLVLAAGLGWALFSASGCNNAQDNPIAPVAVDVPGILAEPEFTGGLTNDVAWNDTGADAYRAEVSTDADFATILASSGWIHDTAWTFTGLEHGITYRYRVQARDTADNRSDWSTLAVSTQDAQPPVTNLGQMQDDQTSLRFTITLEADDDLSGVREVDLWYAVNDGPMEFRGTYAPGPVTILTQQWGTFAFATTGVDAAGNRSDLPAEAQAVTQVPEPIILTDLTGEDFDITNAVLKHHLGENYWRFGLGRNAIQPVINPRMIGPEDPGYPDDQNTTEIIGVRREGDIRAYKIGDIPDREVVDDVVAGQHIAVTY